MDTQELVLRQALIDNYNRYAEGLDSKRWDLVRACFCDRVVLEYGPLSEDGVQPDGRWLADDWIGALQSVINGFDITHHAIGNHRFDFSDGRVRCRAYLTAEHVIFPAGGTPGERDIWRVVGEYSNEYERQGGEWRIARSGLASHWNAGNLSLFDVARERAAAQANVKA